MSWGTVHLSDFLKVRDDRFKPNNKMIEGLKRVDKIDFSGQLHLSNSPSKTEMILVKSGDLLISGINVYKGAVIVYEGFEDITATIHYSSYEYDKTKIDVDFLKLFLKSPEFLDAIKEQVPGGIKTEIKPKHLLPLEVIMPDLNGQREVVKSFSVVDTKQNTLIAELTYQLDLVKKLRQSFLREAMQGKLVEQDPKDVPASELLQKIKDEKEKLVKEKKLKQGKELPPIKEDEIPFAIPDNWVWCRLGEIAMYSEAGKSYQCSDRIAEFNEWGVIKTSAITSGFFIEEENKFLPLNDDNLELMRISKDDIIFCRASGSKGLAGKSCLVKQTPKANLILSDKSIRFVFSENIYRKFIQLYNSSIFAENYYKSLGTGKSTSMNNITRDQFNNFPIPLPPLPEQHRIVAKLEQLMQLCDDLEQSIRQSKEQTNMLLQAALREALQPKAEVVKLPALQETR